MTTNSIGAAELSKSDADIETAANIEFKSAALDATRCHTSTGRRPISTRSTFIDNELEREVLSIAAGFTPRRTNNTLAKM